MIGDNPKGLPMPLDSTAQISVAGPLVSPAGRALSTSAFTSRVTAAVQRHFASLGNPVHGTARSVLAQFWWGADRTVHYEVAVHERTGKLELGLHFEAHGDRNAALLRAFAPCMLDIHHALGDSLWLEEWDRGWTRLYETRPLYPMDDDAADSAAERLCDIMTTLQPLYEALARSI